MTEHVELFGRAVDEFGRRVADISPGQWSAPTPGWPSAAAAPDHRGE